MARDIRRRISLWGSSLLSVLMPAVCEVCGRRLTDGERHVCLPCLTALPRTDFHLSATDNEIHRRVSDNHVLVDRAAAMFHYYRRSPSTALVLSAKYRNRPDIMRRLGRIYAAEIEESGFFDGIDLIVPVPLHWTRRITRGYNQTEYLARGIQSVTGLPVEKRLLRLPRRHATQTRRSAADRAENVAGTFAVTSRAEALRGRNRHILVIDDIITTGSTMRDCLRAITEAIPDATVSVLSLGLAHRL